MQISATSNNNCNFGKILPVLSMITRGKNGQEIALLGQAQQGPMRAFVRKVNNDKFCQERAFLTKWFREFRNYPYTASTSMSSEQPYLVFGSEDILTLDKLYTARYEKKQISWRTLLDEIRNKLIGIKEKRYRHRNFRGDVVGTPVGIVLRPQKVKNGKSRAYNLGIEITDNTGKIVYGVLPSADPQVAAMQPKVNFVFPPPKYTQAEFNFDYSPAR